MRSRELYFWLSIILGLITIDLCRTHSSLEYKDNELRVGSIARFKPPVTEASGLCPDPLAIRYGQSMSHTPLYWTHNDSLDHARAFRITLDARQVNEVEINSALNVDWEACTSTQYDPIDGRDVVYIADSGNNFHWRDQTVVYALRSSVDQHKAPQLDLINTYAYRFPRESESPPLGYWSGESRCLDIESIFWRRGELFMISKCITSESPMLWRLQREVTLDKQADREQFRTLEAITKLPHQPSVHPLFERVTDASYSEEREELLVLTYQSIWLYRVSGAKKRPKFELIAHCDLNIKGRLVTQAEAITWEVDGHQADDKETAPIRKDHNLSFPPSTAVVLTERGDVYSYKIIEDFQRLK